MGSTFSSTEPSEESEVDEGDCLGVLSTDETMLEAEELDEEDCTVDVRLSIARRAFDRVATDMVRE